ncbi:reverse transcriptase domain-containing protein [Tanacetum coccineum]
MSFSLKNFRATYQRLVDATFQSQIGQNLEAYVDDMVVKSKTERDMIADVAKTFDNLRRISMKLNPKKCSFGVEEGKFLGYMVMSEGIRVNPAKTKDIAKMKPPQTWGKMQSLLGKLAVLNSFQELKKVILNMSSLTTQLPKETICVYLAASKEVVIAVLLAKRKGKQCRVHYVSRTLHDAERNYAPLEKVDLALLHVSRRLRRYLEAHPIKVITDQPIKQILNKAEASGKLEKCSMELGAYDLTYEPRNAIKGQVLADFINEVPVCNEASTIKGLGVGLVLISPTKIEYTYAMRLNFTSINNQAEYKALLAGQRIAKKMKYLAKAKEYIECFKNFKIRNIPRNQNQKANVLSKLASVALNHITKEILVEVLETPSIDRQEINAVVEEEEEK